MIVAVLNQKGGVGKTTLARSRRRLGQQRKSALSSSMPRKRHAEAGSVCEMPEREPAMREIAALPTEIERIAR